jgi:HEAT repeat protein
VVKERAAAAEPEGMGSNAGGDGPGQGDPDASVRRLAALIAAAQVDREGSAMVTLLVLGRPAVAAVVATLAAEAAAGRRGQLVGLLEELAPGHLDLVEMALVGAPWYLARNLATVLGHVGEVEHLPLLEELLAHEHPAVRREAVRGMVRLGGVLATAPLAARSADADPGVRRLALHGLAEIDSPAALAALVKASRRGRPAAERRLALSGLARSARPEADVGLREAATRLAVLAGSRSVRAHARALLAARPARSVTFR